MSQTVAESGAGDRWRQDCAQGRQVSLKCLIEIKCYAS